jgi:hypothetical protein
VGAILVIERDQRILERPGWSSFGGLLDEVANVVARMDMSHVVDLAEEGFREGRLACETSASWEAGRKGYRTLGVTREKRSAAWSSKYMIGQAVSRD